MLPVWLTDTITTDIREAVDYTLMWGLEGMVIRTAGKQQQYVPHVNEAQIKGHLQESELLLPAIEPGLLMCSADDLALWKNQIATFNEVVSFCKRVGVPRIITSAFTDGSPDTLKDRARSALSDLAARTHRAGLKLLLRNHPENAYQRAVDLTDLIEAVPHPALQIAWDIEQDIRDDSIRADLDALIPHLGMIFVGAMGDDEYTETREAVVRDLAAQGFSGPACLSFDAVDGPTSALRGSTRLLRLLREIR